MSLSFRRLTGSGIALAVAEELRSSFTDFQMVSAQPNLLTFTAEERFNIIVALDTANLIDNLPPRNSEEAIKIPAKFFELVRRSVEILNLTRVGVRFQYYKQFPTEDDVSKELCKLKLLAIPRSGLFGTEAGAQARPHYRVEVNSEAISYIAQVYGQIRNYSVALPPEAAGIATAINKSFHEIVVDIDVFIKTSTKASSFLADRWLLSAQKNVVRDIDTLLGGSHGG